MNSRGQQRRRPKVHGGMCSSQRRSRRRALRRRYIDAVYQAGYAYALRVLEGSAQPLLTSHFTAKHSLWRMGFREACRNPPPIHQDELSAIS
jgi:hypothetical protein